MSPTRSFALFALAVAVAAACSAGGAPGDDDDATGSGGEAGSGGSGAGSACGPVVEGARCLDDGWCWDAPRPQGVDFNAIDAAADASSVWAVGNLGGAFRRCQGQWWAMDSGTDVTLHGLWHPSADFAVAVGDEGTVIAWDGAAWTKLVAPTSARLLAVWGSAPDDLWIGGDPDESGTVLLHYDGNAFSRAQETAGQSFTIRDIGGPAADQLYAVGGTFECDYSLRFDGSSWTSLPGCHGFPDFGPFTKLALSDDGTVMALFGGFNTSRVYQLQGGDWVESLYLGSTVALGPLFLDGAGRPSVIRATGDPAAPGQVLSFDGAGWPPSGDILRARPGSLWTRPGGAEGWAVGAATTLLERGGDGVWSQLPGVASLSGSAVHLGGASATDLWLITDEQLLHRDGGGWSFETTLGAVATMASVDQAGRPFIVTSDDAVTYYQRGAWTTLPPTGSPSTIRSMLALAPDDVWVVAYSPMHFDGATWSEPWGYCATLSDPSSQWLPDGRRFRRAPDGKAWLVGDRGAFYFDLPGASCSRLISTDPEAFESDSLVDIAWPSSNDAWALTWSGALYQRQGTVLTLRANILPAEAQAEQLIATPEGKLRVIYSEPLEGGDSAIRIATVDPASASLVGTTLTVPGAHSTYHTALWLEDEAHALVAMPGAVMSYGYGP
jgi:hypothetical protein